MELVFRYLENIFFIVLGSEEAIRILNLTFSFKNEIEWKAEIDNNRVKEIRSIVWTQEGERSFLCSERYNN